MINYTLKPHQVEGVDFIRSTPYCILGDAMGLGKTLQAIEAVKREGQQILVVCPAMLRGTWADEIEKFSTLKSIVVTKPIKDINVLASTEVFIVGYSFLNKAKELFKRCAIVIADEVHFLKNVEAGRTQLFHELMISHPPERFIGLSGTAIKNRVPEFFSLLRLCYYNKGLPTDLEDYWRFCRKFCEVSQFRIHNRTVTKFEGHKNVDDLRALLRPIYLRRKASEVLDLPPIIRKDIVLHDEWIDYDLLGAWNENARAFATHKKNSAKIKVKHTARYAKDLLEAGEGPLIIYSDHVEPTENIAKAFPKKFQVRVITGKTPMNKRDEIVRDFQAGKVDVLCATIGALSVGVTLTKSKNIIFNDLSWVPADIAQAEKRIHRIGQEGTCFIHRIFWGKIDFKIGKELDKKIAVLSEVL